VQVEVAVLAPVFRLTIFVFTDSFQVSDVDAANIFLDTPLDDVFGETVEKVSAAFRPLVMESRGFVATRVVALGDFLREVVPVLFQAVAGVQIGFLGAVGDGGEVTDSEVDACCLGAGCGGCLDFIFADEVKFPSRFRLVVDGANLLQVFDRDAGACLVFDKDVLPCFRVFLVISTL